MSFFYDLNKRMATLAAKQDAKQISESNQVEAVARSPLAQALNEAAMPQLRQAPQRQAPRPATQAQPTANKAPVGRRATSTPPTAGQSGYHTSSELATAAAAKYATTPTEKLIAISQMRDLEPELMKAARAELIKRQGRAGQVQETDYSAKKAAAGKDIGKPGKNFAKIAKGAAERYGSKAAGERVAGAVLNKLRHPKESAEKDGDVMDYLNDQLKDYDAQQTEEGNEFTGNLAKAKAQHKDEFEVDGKKYKVVEADPTGLGEEAMDEGYAEMDAWLKSREKEKGTGRFDKKKISTGTVYTRKPETFDDPETEPEATGGAPKRKGRPAGTKRAIGAKHSGRSKLARKDAIAEEIPVTDRGEYDQEGESAKHDIKTIVRHAQALHKILGDNDNLPEWVQSKLSKIEGMMIAVDEYMQNQDQEVSEKAPPGAKAERMVKHIKKSLSKDGKLSDKDKAIAYATTWKAHNAGKVEEEGAKPDFLDVDKDGDKKEAFKKAVADKKEKKVDETTTSGSVATATDAPKKSKGGMQFGKGVYEGLSSKLENMIAESMNVTVNMSTDEQGQAQKSITVTATDEDADKLAELLKMAGVESKQEVCPGCGSTDCGCEEEIVDENSPDWPTNTEKLAAQPELRTYSGGLNGPKSTGQTTIPVIASQLRRQVSMEENVELERTLFKTWKNYKG